MKNWYDSALQKNVVVYLNVPTTTIKMADGMPTVEPPVLIGFVIRKSGAENWAYRYQTTPDTAPEAIELGKFGSLWEAKRAVETQHVGPLTATP